MMKEIKVGFIDGKLTYETWLSSSTKVYKEELGQSYCFELYKRNAITYLVRIMSKNFFFTSTGTIGRPLAKSFKWNLHLEPVSAPENEWHTVFRDAKGDLSFCDGDWHEKKEREEKAKREAEEKEIDRIVNLIVTRYKCDYKLIRDKEFFIKQLKEYVYDYRFDLQENEEEVLNSARECFSLFLSGERELPTYIQNLTYDKIIQEYPHLGRLGLSELEVREIIDDVIKEMKCAEKWGPWITEYKDEIYLYFESEIKGCLYEKQQLEEKKKKEEIIEKYPVEKLMEKFDHLMSECENVEKMKECIDSALKNDFKWWRVTEEIEFLQVIEKEIIRFLEGEKRQKELNDFHDMWGDEKFIELTLEKRTQFSKVESGECMDDLIINEYHLYKKLLAEYEELVYRKNRKGLKPTFAAIPSYFDHFLKIVELAKKHHLIDTEGVFLSWDEFDRFNRAVRKYENSLIKN